MLVKNTIINLFKRKSFLVTLVITLCTSVIVLFTTFTVGTAQDSDYIGSYKLYLSTSYGYDCRVTCRDLGTNYRPIKTRENINGAASVFNGRPVFSCSVNYFGEQWGKNFGAISGKTSLSDKCCISKEGNQCLSNFSCLCGQRIN